VPGLFGAPALFYSRSGLYNLALPSGAQEGVLEGLVFSHPLAPQFCAIASILTAQVPPDRIPCIGPATSTIHRASEGWHSQKPSFRHYAFSASHAPARKACQTK
jgi:hypothetical protein